MIQSLLIANRGEIARRIARTCRELGICAVAVYSDADADTPVVREADLALRLGPAPARESYLDGETLLLLARGNGCDAIHPGYGFLSENAAFSAACAERGVIFVGAPPEAIRAMGDKAEAKRLMAEAGVPVIPGHAGADDPQTLATEAERIGYPLLVKAVAGGGGRGIRRVDAPGDLAEAAESARREAAGAFGDGRLMLEKYLLAPRHVEFQVLADAHGHTVHLFERECSVQRRHQKLIEETPSPAIGPALREAMGAAAVRAAQAIGYVGAGTVEFLVDADGGFYFLEMNTRLQVEHPVTEMTLGLDLVRLQIEVAEGRPLAFTQGELTQRGHAIECRLNAEDPHQGFLPAVGRLGRLHLPEGPGIRVDAGFAAGSEIGSHYDSLLAKLIAWGDTREAALRQARRMLAETFVGGLPTNLPFLQWVLHHPGFAAGDYTTHLLDEDAAGWHESLPLPPTDEVLAAVAAVESAREAGPRATAPAAEGQVPGRDSPWAAARTWRGAPGGAGLAGTRLRRVRWNGAVHEVHWRHEGEGLVVQVSGATHRLRWLPLADEGHALLDLGGARVPLRWDARGRELWLSLRGAHLRLTVEDPIVEALEGAPADPLEALRAPLPGKVIQVATRSGATVALGDLLMVVEAMKVEHRITAPFAGTVGSLHFAAGDPVERDDLLLELEPEGKG